MATKFGYYQKRSDDNTCVGDHHYNCEFGVWKKLENKVLGGAAQPWGDKKFATLDQAQKFACDKVTDKNTVVASLCDDNNVYHVGSMSSRLTVGSVTK